MRFFGELVQLGPRGLEHRRAVFVPDSLNDLQGPDAGTVTLPVHLDWGGANVYDLSNPVRVRSLYATVLREAPDEQDICAYVNRAVLAREWRLLNLPAHVRAVWEQQHPELKRRTRDGVPVR